MQKYTFHIFFPHKEILPVFNVYCENFSIEIKHTIEIVLTVMFFLRVKGFFCYQCKEYIKSLSL